MRSIFVFLFVFLFFILGLPVLGIEWLLGKKNKKASDLRQLKTVQWAFRCILFLSGVKLEVYGHEKVPKDEAVMYIGNHRGIFDIVTSYSLCDGLTGYIAKDVIKKVPILRIWMTRLHCQFMVREDIKQSMKVILAAIEQIKEGISVCIYPEGTRSKNVEHPEELLPFKEGSFKIAQKTGCKIVPMGIVGTDAILENHKPWIKKGKIVLIYGNPIDPKSLSKEQKIGEYCQNIVTELVKEAMTK